MSLTAGANFGSYEVVREIGRGGMGVVYLGRDTRLDRLVAIKSLPAELASDPDRLARFEREARLLASLNHPNIAGIHGVQEHDGHRYLILEYVEGESLADRLDRGGIPLDEAIEFATQIAAGVEAAHDAGVIHRDLKPGNIIVTPDGQAKVLDFGLARADETDASSSSVSQLPTLTSPAQHSPTIPGVILGTAAYMSPEQARGRRVDKRTDIWSFGVILYEMLSGASPFVGETVSDSIGAVLHKDVDRSRLPSSTPSNVRRVLDRCLERDKSMRYRDIGDARIDLLRSHDPEPESASAARSLNPGVVAVVAVVVAALAAAGVWLFKPAPPTATMHVAIPVNTIPTPDGPGPQTLFDVAPSGTRVAYIGIDPDDDSEDRVQSIYVRDLDSPQPRRLEGTEHAYRLSFSPSGDQIAFAANDPDMPNVEMRRIRADGGPPVTLFVDPPRYRMSYPPCWLDDDRIAYIGDDYTSIYIGAASGGFPDLFANLKEVIPNFIFTIEIWSPPDTDYLYITGIKGGNEDEIQVSVYELDLQTRALRVIVEDGGQLRIIDGDIAVFFSRDAFSAAKWDANTRSIVGEIHPLTASLDRSRVTLEISQSGTLVFADPPGSAENSRVMSVDRQGRVTPVSDVRRIFAGYVSVSPDGQQLGVIVDTNRGPQAQILDSQSGRLVQAAPFDMFTVDPFWTADGRFIYSEVLSVLECRLREGDVNSGHTAGDVLIESTGWGTSLSRDGEIAFSTRAKSSGSDYDLVAIEIESGQEHLLLETPIVERAPELSPDGDLLAYYSVTPNGERRIELRTFDRDALSLGARSTLVSQPGRLSPPFWSPDGDTLYWTEANTGALMAADVVRESQPEGAAALFRVSEPRVILGDEMPLIHTDYPDQPIAVSPDGERFYFIEARRSPVAPAYLNVVLNWDEEIRSMLESR